MVEGQKKQKTKTTCTQLILPSHVEDNINFVSMRNKGNHHGRKADILWTLSVREGGEGSGVGPTTSLLESYAYETTSPLMILTETVTKPPKESLCQYTVHIR